MRRGETGVTHQKVNVDWLAQLGEQSLGLRRLVKIARARWRVEMDYRELKEELGLDHYEGRGWRGFHHHLTMAALAYLFVVVDFLRSKKNFRPDVGTGLASDAAIAGAFTRLLSLLPDGI